MTASLLVLAVAVVASWAVQPVVTLAGQWTAEYVMPRLRYRRPVQSSGQRHEQGPRHRVGR